MIRLFKGSILGLAIGILGLIIGMSSLGLTIEERIGLDLLQYGGQRKPPSDVVIISLDKQSSDFFNVSDDYRKWPRSIHAKLIEGLLHEGVAVIVFGYIF